MTTKDIITNKLHEAFSPESLDVQDESHLHEGHAGHRPGGETHFRIYIVSQSFKGKTRIDRHRMINATLEDVKVKYKALVKQHHPDANGGDRSTEDRLIEIIKAYNYLKTVVRA